VDVNAAGTLERCGRAHDAQGAVVATFGHMQLDAKAVDECARACNGYASAHLCLPLCSSHKMLSLNDHKWDSRSDPADQDAVNKDCKLDGLRCCVCLDRWYVLINVSTMNAQTAYAVVDRPRAGCALPGSWVGGRADRHSVINVRGRPCLQHGVLQNVPAEASSWSHARPTAAFSWIGIA